jgi:hypothetical protein
MIERPEFLRVKEGRLTPFTTAGERKQYFYNELKKYPMLLIV